MLRRAPTSITLTQDDITRYEEARQKRLRAQQQAEMIFETTSKASQAAEQSTADARGNRSKEERIMGASSGR
jgi:hypothetical protein